MQSFSLPQYLSVFPANDDASSATVLRQIRARRIVQLRNDGYSFKSISDDFGVSRQTVAQIFHREINRTQMVDTAAHKLSKHTRRKLQYALEMDIAPSDIVPKLVASRLHTGDLRRLGARVHRETVQWLEDHGFTVIEGFFKYWQFNGLWKARFTHWPDGRVVPWVVDGVHTCCAINCEFANIHYNQRQFKILLEDLLIAFQRIG